MAYPLCFHVIISAFILVTTAESDSEIIKRILHYYKGGDPPSDEATDVRLGIYVNSFYGVSERTMDYTMNLYLRQAWKDARLQFDAGDKKTIIVDAGQMNEIWRPDTFFRNEKGASFHSVTVPNKLMKVNATGHVWYVVKLSLKLSCPMKLQKFPFDTQACPMMFESFGYTMDTLTYSWLDAPVDVDRGVQLPAFMLKDIVLNDCSQNYTAGAFPCLELDFILSRDIGYYIWQVYLPSMGLVVLSWFTFWFPAEAHGTRIILLLMPVLCLSSMSHSLHGVLPKVSYLKAIDIWMMGCGAFVFAVIVELAIVNILGDSKDKDAEEPSDTEEGLLVKMKKGFTTGSKTSRIDKICRVVFPLAFLLFVILYFISYAS